MYNWFSLEKHATQGTCIRLKVGFAQGKTLPQILEEVKRKEVQRPPVPPEDLPKQLQLSDLLEHEVFYSAIQDTPKHAGFLNEVGAECLLCGQRVLQVARLKTHWQQQRPKAWVAVKSQAASESKSMCATFSRPCAYCGSCAKDSRQHSGQCGVYFQAASMRFLLREHKLEPDLIGSKDIADKQHLHPPAYQAFQLEKTPIGCAFGAAPSAPPSDISIRVIRASESVSTVTTDDTTISRPSAWLPSGPAGTITAYFPTRPTAPNQELSAPAEPNFWAGRLRLRNPHSLCYVTSSVVALLHTLDVISRAPESLRVLTQVCREAADEGREVRLDQQPSMLLHTRKMGPLRSAAGCLGLGIPATLPGTRWGAQQSMGSSLTH